MDSTIKDFESAIAELETIVKTLEGGDLALEKSLALFERGVQLSRFCHAQLEAAERRIEILTEREPKPLQEREKYLVMRHLRRTDAEIAEPTTNKHDSLVDSRGLY